MFFLKKKVQVKKGCADISKEHGPANLTPAIVKENKSRLHSDLANQAKKFPKRFDEELWIFIVNYVVPGKDKR